MTDSRLIPNPNSTADYDSVKYKIQKRPYVHTWDSASKSLDFDLMFILFQNTFFLVNYGLQFLTN